MRPFGWFAATTALFSAVAFSPAAAADTMDPALARLVTDASCRSPGQSGGGDYFNGKVCRPDNPAFAKLVAQYGFAIAPTAMHSARTTGFGGVDIAIETDFTSIDSDAEYWQKGTQGAQDPSTRRFSVINKSPDSLLQLYSLKIRKGFPLGLELTGTVGYLANTNIVTGGADVRWSLLEGFRTGIPAIFPELAVGGSVRTMTGTPELQLTVAGVDAQLSKPLPLAGSVVLTPYVGYQWIRIFGDSGLIDFTPNTDAVNYCGFTGSNTPAVPDPKKGYHDGAPVCANGLGTAADFNNTSVFDPVRLTRHRLDFGAQLRFEMVRFGAHFVTDLVSAQDANQGGDYESPTPDTTDDPSATANDFEGVKKQWTLAFDLGAVF